MKYLFGNFVSVLRHYKSASMINIIGLSAAFVVFFVVLMQTRYDLTYDRGYPTGDRLVQFIQDWGGGNAGTYINFQIPAMIKDKVPEIEAHCMTSNWGASKFDVGGEDGDGTAVRTYDIDHLRATSGFWQVFRPEVVAGDTTGILSAYGRALISERTAETLFWNEDPIGKSIRYHYGDPDNPDRYLTIAAVYRDFPENSSVKNGIFTHLPEYDEEELSFQAYFLVEPDNLKSANDKIDYEELMGAEQAEQLRAEYPHLYDNIYRLERPGEIYLSQYLGSGPRMTSVVSLLAIAILTLVIAFVNFVNLSLAMAPSRVRGINIRRILGVNKSVLRIVIAMESVLFCLIALGIALVAVHYLKNTALAGDIFASDLSVGAHAGLITLGALGVLAVAFCIGLYTSRYSTSFEEWEALKGSFALGIKSVRLRNILIVFQFTTAIVLICFTLLINRQNTYMRNHNWGFEKENIIYLPLYGLWSNVGPFSEEIMRDPRIENYSISRVIPGEQTMSWGRDFEGKSINLTVWSVDERFFDLFGVDIVAGEKPMHMDSLVSQIVVNRAFLKEYEFDESIVGKDFPAFGPGRIVGVAKDINFLPLRYGIGPMAFGVLAQWQNFQYVIVKLNGNDVPGAIEYVEQTWNKFSNDPFELHFLDRFMDDLYSRESNMAKLLGTFGLIIVIIAVMGVYGLIMFNTRYKRKEIGIRKVNGATTGEIVLMLNRSMLILIGIAFVIAVPVSWYVITRWLEGFAYRTTAPWWLFAGAGLLVLAISVVAVSWQSWRAANTNPAEVIKSE